MAEEDDDFDLYGDYDSFPQYSSSEESSSTSYLDDSSDNEVADGEVGEVPPSSSPIQSPSTHMPDDNGSEPGTTILFCAYGRARLMGLEAALLLNADGNLS